jgi:hypothetical protein
MINFYGGAEYRACIHQRNRSSLFVEHKWESDRYESENRLMIVQLPLREDVFIPGEGVDEDGDTEEFFSQLQDAFDDNLKRSVLYPWQEIPDLEDGDNSAGDTDETGEAAEDDPESDSEGLVEILNR